MAIPIDQALDVKEVAAILKVSQKTVRRMVNRGELESARIGTLIRFNRETIDRKLGKSKPIAQK